MARYSGTEGTVTFIHEGNVRSQREAVDRMLSDVDGAVRAVPRPEDTSPSGVTTIEITPIRELAHRADNEG